MEVSNSKLNTNKLVTSNQPHVIKSGNQQRICLLSGRKAPTFRPLRETKLPLSGAVEQKNRINTLASKTESLRSYVIVSRGEAETFLILLA